MKKLFLKIQNFIATRIHCPAEPPLKKYLQPFFEWSRSHRLMIILAVLIIIVPPVFILVSGVYLPAKKEGHIYVEGQVAPSLPLKSENKYSGLSKEEVNQLRTAQSLEMMTTYQKNRLAMAQNDSTYMSVNLTDSTILLAIKGVTVRTVKIKDMEISRRFRIIEYPELHEWISKPFILQQRIATIPVSPLIVKEAPKDTAEANQISDLPRPLENTEVHFKLQFSRNLVLQIDQIEDTISSGHEKVSRYFANQRKNEFRNSLKLALGLSKPDYQMNISFLLDGEDARAIYRSLPSDAELALLPE